MEHGAQSEAATNAVREPGSAPNHEHGGPANEHAAAGGEHAQGGGGDNDTSFLDGLGARLLAIAQRPEDVVPIS